MPPKTNAKRQLFATCAPGVESLLCDELKQLNVGNAVADNGGVAFTGTLETIARINLQSRIADRLLYRLGSFSALQLAEFEKKAAALPFADFITGNARVAINATCKKSKIYHSGAAAERIARAIQSQVSLQEAPTCQIAADHSLANTQHIQVRMIRDQAMISVDTSGTHLHQRGYRTHVTAAPLRENIAAAALRFCEYSGDRPLVNPMCGSGTIAIEAALIASRRAPNLNRQFAFESWPCFEADIMDKEKQRAHKYIRPFDGMIYGSDLHAAAIDAAVHNAGRAQVADHISLKTEEISQTTLPEAPGLLIVNPPWGKRLLGDQSSQRRVAPRLHALYEAVGRLKKQHPNWTACVITSNARLAKATGIDFKRISAPIPMGGIRLKFYAG